MDLRKYFLKIKGHIDPPTAEMEHGKLKHELYTKKLKTIEQYGLNRFRKDLYKGKEIELKELKICSNILGMRGIVDQIKLKLDLKNKKFEVDIVELKSGWFTPYIFQINVYGLIFSNNHTRIVYKRKKKRGKGYKRLLLDFLPKFELSRDIRIDLRIFGNKERFKYFMKDNLITKKNGEFVSAILKKAKQLRKLHNLSIMFINEIPACRGCNQGFNGSWRCGLWSEICSKINNKESIKTKQRYFGKTEKKMLIKSKPQVYL
ncbi:hypothetical protein KKF32_05280 [Patescibacteria group bacterium]|nr:hypothetical protein [Patescibacteria group bacterium]